MPPVAMWLSALYVYPTALDGALNGKVARNCGNYVQNNSGILCRFVATRTVLRLRSWLYFHLNKSWDSERVRKKDG
jgi:hypothetical protein